MQQWRRVPTRLPMPPLGRAFGRAAGVDQPRKASQPLIHKELIKGLGARDSRIGAEVLSRVADAPGRDKGEALAARGLELFGISTLEIPIATGRVLMLLGTANPFGRRQDHTRVLTSSEGEVRARAHQEAVPYSGAMRVLVAEDEARLRSLVERALRESGYAVDSFADGASALFAAETDSFDLMILDIMMPGAVDSVEVCRRVRAADSDVPILLLTALDAPQHRVHGLDSGADDYLVKPFHLSELLARVRALLRRAPLAIAPVPEHGELRLVPAAHTVTQKGPAARVGDSLT